MIFRLLSALYKSRSFGIICRLTLSIVFIYAAVGKILKPEDFAESVAAFRILPVQTVNLFALILPWVELLSGASLLTGILVRSGSLLLGGLNAVFIIAAASAMMRGLNIGCGCFTLSHAHDNVGWTLIGRDTLFLFLSLRLILIKNPVEKKLLPDIDGSSTPPHETDPQK